MSRNSAGEKNNRCKILWGVPSGRSAADNKTSKVLTDKTWAHTYSHETLGLVTITAKAGNRALTLENYSEDLKTKISRAVRINTGKCRC